MRAYKVLIDGRSGFTGWRWPLPDDGAPGDWVVASGTPELCVNGIHACTVHQLPQWLGEELWTIELAGEIVRTDAALVASKGRLLARVEAWSGTARTAFGQDCARRAHEAAIEGPSSSSQLLAAVNQLAAGGRAGPAGYWAAVLAGERASATRTGPKYDAAFAQERAAQARWLETELGALD
ncbi:MAG: hypothetical protein ACXVFQ_10070 [Solirubrobacteraceae bacterium]